MRSDGVKIAVGRLRHCTSLDGVLFLSFVAILLYSYWTYAMLPLTRPSASDYSGATTHIRARFQPGDLIDANPFWAVRVREYLGDFPMANFRRIDREDLSAYRRLWLFSLFGAEERETIRDGLDARYSLLEERRFGRINVRLYELPEPAPVLYDFREQLHQADVWIEGRGGRRNCDTWTAGRWRCSSLDWNYVGREILEIGGEPRSVIWAHPVGDATLVIEFPEVPVGRRLSLGTGFAASAFRRRGVPVSVVVEIDGKPVSHRQQQPLPGLFVERIDTAAFQGGRHRVSFRVSSSDNHGRHFCFSARAEG